MPGGPAEEPCAFRRRVECVRSAQATAKAASQLLDHGASAERAAQDLQRKVDVAAAGAERAWATERLVAEELSVARATAAANEHAAQVLRAEAASEVRGSTERS